MSKFLSRSLISCLFLFLTSTFAIAQSSTATLSGTVEDTNGQVIPNATVTISDVAKGFERKATTNDSGSYTFVLLPASTYTLLVEQTGFGRAQVENIVLNVGDQKALQIQLRVGDVNAAIEVRADATLIRTDGSVGTVINREQIARMPLNGQSFHALIQLTPGVVLTTNESGSATSGAQFSVNGQRTTSNYFTVDGVSANTGISANLLTNNPGQAGAGTGIGATALGGTNSLASLDALQEFRIETSTFAAEFGRTPGGQVSLVTRAGTNSFTGSLAYYLRNEALDANNWFANAGGQPRPRQRQNYVSGTLGGPVFFPAFGEGTPAIWNGKNRLFFFASYEGLRLEQPTAKQIVVPSLCLRGVASCPVGQSPAAVALQPFLNAMPLPNGQDFGNGTAQLNASWSNLGSFNIFGVRIDGKVTDSLTAFFRFNHAPSQTTTRTLALNTLNHTKALNNVYTGGLTWLAGPRLTADVRFNWTENQARASASLDNFHGAVIPDPAAVFAPGRDPSNSVLSFRGGLSADSQFTWGTGSSDKQRQLNLVSTVAYVAGSHQFKFGLDYRRLMPIFGQTGGTFERAQFISTSSLVSGRVGLVNVANAAPIQRKAIIPALSLFAQDTWNVTNRLTLTYGVRYEYLPSPGEATGQFPPVLLGIETDTPQNVQLAPSGTPLFETIGSFAPRFGVAYQLNRRSGWETTLRGGVGQFYDLPFGAIADNFASAWPFFVSQNFFNVPYPPHPVPLAPGSNQPTSFSLLDPNIKLPYTIQWNAAWEQGIGRDQSITATYVAARGHRLLGYEQVIGVGPSPSRNITITNWPTGPISVFLFRGRNISQSRYDALQLQYIRRLSHRLQGLASYTFGRSIDDLSSNTGNPTTDLSGDPFTHSFGASDFDVRHVFSSAISYDLPSLKKGRLIRFLTEGWGTDLLFRYQSAPPYNPANFGASIVSQGVFLRTQLNLIPGVPIYVEDPTAPGGRRLNIEVPTAAQIAQAGCSATGAAKGAFCTPPTGQQGNFPRNGLRGFPASQVDLTVRRELRLGDQVRIQLRAELFNLFNHPNFSGIDIGITSPTFGRARQTLNTSLGGLNSLYQMGGPRSGQLAIKVLW